MAVTVCASCGTTADLLGWRVSWYDRRARRICTQCADSLLGDYEGRKIAATDLGNGVTISTVCLVLGGVSALVDDVPTAELYESMVFGGFMDRWCWRYATEEAALAGHDQLVMIVRDHAKEIAQLEENFRE